MAWTEIEAWSRANITGLEVSGDTIGKSHSFTFEGHKVRVALPRPFKPRGHQPKGEDAGYDLSKHKVKNPQRRTSSYRVSWLNVSIALPQKLNLPSGLLTRPPKSPEIAGPKLSKRLDQLAPDYETRIAASLAYWKEVVRWITGHPSLDHPGITSARPESDGLSFTCLRTQDAHHRFWAPTTGLAIHMSTAISSAIWSKIGRALEDKLQPPIWFNYQYEASLRLTDHDLAGAVLSAAIACETLIREMFWLCSGETNNEAARDILNRISVSSIHSKWNKITGIPNARSKVAEVRRLFELRNKIMHRGAGGAELSQSQTRQLLTDVRTFIDLGDRQIYRMKGVANPRLKGACL